MSNTGTPLPQPVMQVPCGQPTGEAASKGEVQLSSGAVKQLEDPQPGECYVSTTGATTGGSGVSTTAATAGGCGVSITAASASGSGVSTFAVTAGFDLGTQCYLQRILDLAVLREGYNEWYKSHNGKQIGMQLLERFNRYIRNTQLQHHTADRFSSILNKAIRLCDEEGEDELLEVCKQVIADDARLDVESFVELQRLIRDIRGHFQEPPARSEFEQAAARTLKHRTFANLVAAVLPEESPQAG